MPRVMIDDANATSCYGGTVSERVLSGAAARIQYRRLPKAAPAAERDAGGETRMRVDRVPVAPGMPRASGGGRGCLTGDSLPGLLRLPGR
ncbi:hypothetical protein Nans01_14770 [Nocardiopsis ansamitocini]|uniref:Uncharacterized protein n=1 Tax=Nocardiopsis ansamitocini TaxID=1670832 RepID=A0A9W6P4Q7_9ACTN|nr:hypothetical protein Nans01_14770 [Nocardiopsis ansamitocini]